MRIVSAIARRDPGDALSAVNEAIESGQDVRQLNRQVSGLIRDALQVASGISVQEFTDELAAVVALRTLPELVEIASGFIETDSLIRSSAIPQLPLELAILRATVTQIIESASTARVERSSSSPEPIRRNVPRPTAPSDVAEPDLPAAAPPTQKWSAMAQNRTAPRQIRDEPTPIDQNPSRQPEPPALHPPIGTESAAEPIAVGDGETLSVQHILDMWAAIRSDVKSLDRRIEALMLEIDPVDVSANRLTLVSQYEFHRNMLNDASRKTVIESVVSRRLGRPYRVDVLLRSDFDASVGRDRDTPARPETVVDSAEMPADTGTEPERTSDEQITDEAGQKFLGAVLRMFDGTVIEEDPIER
jgi:DNA polymerase-3 subunit gamma/tau